MRAFLFDDSALERIAKRRQAESKIFVVFGYQFESKYYDSNELKKNIAARLSRLQNLFSDLESLDISLEFRPLKGGLGKHLFEDILVDIASADIAIFEVSDLNPNVFLEMGVALSHGVPVIPLKHKDSGKIPSDISGLMWVMYDDNGRILLDENFDYDLQVLVSSAKKRSAVRKPYCSISDATRSASVRSLVHPHSV